MFALSFSLGLPSTHPEKLVPDEVSSNAAPTAPAPAEMALSDWMGGMSDVMGDKTLLDISVPGTHDSLTFDLTGRWPYNADTPQAFLHIEKPVNVPPIVWGAVNSVMKAPSGMPDKPTLGDVAKGASACQYATLIEQLDNGIRFFDFRITQGTAKNQDSPESFLGTHTIATEHSAVHHIKTMLAWLDAHPKEIVAVMFSSHGDGNLGCGGPSNRAESDFCGILPEGIKSKVEALASCPAQEDEVDESGFLKDAYNKGKDTINKGKDWAKDKIDEGKDWAKDKIDEGKEWTKDKANEAAAKILEPIIQNYGPKQYFGKVSTSKAFMDWMVTEAGDKIVNVVETPIDTTTLNELWAKKRQLLVYAAGYCEFSGQDVGNAQFHGGEGLHEPGTGGTPYAYPVTNDGWSANRVANMGYMGMVFAGRPQSTKQALNNLKNVGEGKREEYKKKNKYYMLSGISSARTDEAIAAAKIGWFDDFTELLTRADKFGDALKEKISKHSDALLGLKHETKEACATYYEIPGVDNYCADSAVEQGALTNYYLQNVFQKAWENGYDLPNTYHIDSVVRSGGGMDIGGGKSYPYSQLFIHTNFRNICGTDADKYTPACAKVAATLPEFDAKAKMWDDPSDGRIVTSVDL